MEEKVISIPGQIPTTLINHLIKKHDNVESALDKINKMYVIQNNLKEARQQKAKLIKEHEEKLAKLNEAIKNSQKECKHDLVETYSDPAGGSDNSVVCQICDLEL